MNLELKHTPGKWQCKKPKGSNGYLYVTTPSSESSIVIYPSGNDTEGKANGKLIAAAPEMLMTLIEIVNQWDKDIMAASYMMEVRELIKKATE